jgi:hypothetical protein
VFGVATHLRLPLETLWEMRDVVDMLAAKASIGGKDKQDDGSKTTRSPAT